MHYFAKLKIGRTYILPTVTFEYNEEKEVSKELFDYLETIVETKVVLEGSKHVLKVYPRFELREEELTQEEKILDSLADVDDELGPKKPGRKPKAPEAE